NWGTMGSDGKNLGISVGSFSKTNPPGGGFRGVLRGFDRVLGWFPAWWAESEANSCGSCILKDTARYLHDRHRALQTEVKEWDRRLALPTTLSMDRRRRHRCGVSPALP